MKKKRPVPVFRGGALAVCFFSHRPPLRQTAAQVRTPDAVTARATRPIVIKMSSESRGSLGRASCVSAPLPIYSLIWQRGCRRPITSGTKARWEIKEAPGPEPAVRCGRIDVGRPSNKREGWRDGEGREEVRENGAAACVSKRIGSA